METCFIPLAASIFTVSRTGPLHRSPYGQYLVAIGGSFYIFLLYPAPVPMRTSAFFDRGRVTHDQ